MFGLWCFDAQEGYGAAEGDVLGEMQDGEE